MLFLMSLHHPLEPRVTPPYIVQIPCLVVTPEDLPIFSQLCVDVPGHQPRLGVLAQGVHDVASLDERGLAGADLALGKCDLEILADLLEQLALQVTDATAESGDLVDAPVAVEVTHELEDGLQEAGTLAVLAGAEEAA